MRQKFYFYIFLFIIFAKLILNQLTVVDQLKIVVHSCLYIYNSQFLSAHPSLIITTYMPLNDGYSVPVCLVVINIQYIFASKSSVLILNLPLTHE